MRKFLLGVLLLPAVAVAQPVTVEKPVQCEKAETIIKGLISSEYREQPVWVGQDDKSRYSVFANPKTGSWTLIQFNDRIACVLGAGENSRLVFSGPQV
jgi:hypothetical protein